MKPSFLARHRGALSALVLVLVLGSVAFFRFHLGGSATGLAEHQSAGCGGSAEEQEQQNQQSEAVTANVAGGLFANVLDRSGVEWASIRGLSGSAFHTDWVTRKNQGFMLVNQEVDEIDGSERVAGVWQKNVDNREWASWRNLSNDAFAAKWTELKNAGFIPIDQDSYTLGGTRYYSGIWIQNKEGLAWASYRNLTSAEFSSYFTTYKNQNYLPIDVEAYPSGSQTLYSVIWVKNTEGFKWWLWRDLSDSAYAAYFQQYQNTHRVLDLESYQSGGAQRYAAIWIENKNGRAWAAYRDMSSTSFGNKWKQLNDAGLRLVDFEAYPYAGGTRYAGLWRQNDDKWNWVHKSAVDAIVDKAMTDFTIPGMSIAIAKGGTFKYLRGSGWADVADQKAAHSGTIYRLASVSKGIAGVLALDLQERGLVDLTRTTRSYVPSMPDFHTHSVAQTLTCRSGIGHYDENGSPDDDDHFDTAFSAIQFFEDQPLVANPGTQYFYSTHAYTVTGAALEASTGKNLETIVQDDLTNRYGLGTLKVEDRDVIDDERSSLYSWNGTSNDQTAPDDTSWKILGGGLESSAIDLARFGNKLLAGQILEKTALDTLWKAPDDLRNYAYGWWRANERCTWRVNKDGVQLGANTYIQIYPDKGIVIVVLTNRKTGGHSAETIGKAIGTAVLATECP